MINFDEELSKFKPMLEVEQAEIIIRNQNLEDMADVAVGIISEARDEAARAAASAAEISYRGMGDTMAANFEVPDALL